MREKFLSLQKEEIENIFEEFYQTLFSEKYIRHFFKSQQQIKELIKKQILFIQKANLLNKENKLELQKYIEKIVLIHHENNIPFELFINALEYLKDLFIQKLAKNDTNLRIYISNLFDFIEKMSSKYYAKILLKEEREIIIFYEKMYRKFLEKKQFNTVTFHLSWLLVITDSFLKEEKKEIYLLEENCIFKKISIYREFLQDPFINNLHKRVHESAYFLYYLFFDKEDYRNFIYAYSDLSKEVYNFTIALVNKFLFEEKNQAVIDPLTKLYNRRKLEKVALYQTKTARALNFSVAFLMIDIDNFKEINDKYGHLAGDKALRMVAEIIKRNIRKSDYAFRYGGEEFLIILSSVDKETAHKIAERIREDVEKQTLILDDQEVKITVSIGVAVFEKEKLLIDFPKMIKIVDNALYTAKNNGKNQVVIKS